MRTRSIIILFTMSIVMALSSTIALADEQGEYVYQELLDNLIIDARIEAPKLESWMLGSATAIPLTFDAGEVEQLLTPGAKPIKEHRSENDQYFDGSSYSASFDNYTNLVCEPSRIFFATDLFWYIDQLESLVGIANEQALSQPNLPFATREDAQVQAEEVLNELCIGEYRLIHTYTYPHERMQQETANMRKHNKNQRLNIKEQWTQNDDCYQFDYELLLEGVPLSNFVHLANGFYYPLFGSSISVLISAEGIAAVNATGLYTQYKLESIEPLLTAEEALECLERKYSNRIITEPYRVLGMKLQYVPMPISGDRKHVDCIPAWCFLIAKSNIDDLYSFEGLSGTHWTAFDARNGRELYC